MFTHEFARGPARAQDVGTTPTGHKVRRYQTLLVSPSRGGGRHAEFAML